MRIDYNPAVSPPAPFVPIAIAHPLRPTAHRAVSAKVDTGADITALPVELVQGLVLSQKHLLEVAGYDNELTVIPTYDVLLELAQARVRLEVVAVPDEYALLGRDVLNLLRLLLDGPALTLEISE